MKKNNTSVEIRLKNRITKLQMKICPETVPIGYTNPYHMCRGCGQSVPYISIEGHRKGCYIVGIKNEIKHYEKLLAVID